MYEIQSTFGQVPAQSATQIAKKSWRFFLKHGEQTSELMTNICCIVEVGEVVSRLDFKGAKVCKSDRSRQELIQPVSGCKIWLRYSRERVL